MAAAREEGLIQVIAVNKAGQTVTLMGNRDTRQLAPTGKIAEPEQWFEFPLSNKILDGTNGWTIQLIMTGEATDILDNVNDTIAKIPVILNGVSTTVGKSQFQMKSGQLYATPSITVDAPTIIGAWPLTSGELVQFGGSKGWFEPFDDTA